MYVCMYVCMYAHTHTHTHTLTHTHHKYRTRAASLRRESALNRLDMRPENAALLSSDLTSFCDTFSNAPPFGAVLKAPSAPCPTPTASLALDLRVACCASAWKASFLICSVFLHTHASIGARTHTYTRKRAHSRTRAYARTHMHARPPARAHTHTHTHKHI